MIVSQQERWAGIGCSMVVHTCTENIASKECQCLQKHCLVNTVMAMLNESLPISIHRLIQHVREMKVPLSHVSYLYTGPISLGLKHSTETSQVVFFFALFEIDKLLRLLIKPTIILSVYILQHNL